MEDDSSAASRPDAAPDSKASLRWTADKASREIKRELDAGDPSFAMRVVFMAIDSLSILNEPERLQFLQEPPSTGRIRWDALLARAIAFKCQELGVEPPTWTNIQPLRRIWYATPRQHVSEAWKARMASNTPPEFSASNIMIDARELT